MLFWNKVLRRIFGPKREALTGGWRKLDEMTGCVALMEQVRNACTFYSEILSISFLRSKHTW
jgi:hypothetical protein